MGDYLIVFQQQMWLWHIKWHTRAGIYSTTGSVFDFKIFDLIFNFGAPCRVLVGSLFDALNSVLFSDVDIEHNYIFSLWRNAVGYALRRGVIQATIA